MDDTWTLLAEFSAGTKLICQCHPSRDPAPCPGVEAGRGARHHCLRFERLSQTIVSSRRGVISFGKWRPSEPTQLKHRPLASLDDKGDTDE